MVFLGDTGSDWAGRDAGGHGQGQGRSRLLQNSECAALPHNTCYVAQRTATSLVSTGSTGSAGKPGWSRSMKGEGGGCTVSDTVMGGRSVSVPCPSTSTSNLDTLAYIMVPRIVTFGTQTSSQRRAQRDRGRGGRRARAWQVPPLPPPKEPRSRPSVPGARLAGTTRFTTLCAATDRRVVNEPMGHACPMRPVRSLAGASSGGRGGQGAAPRSQDHSFERGQRYFKLRRCFINAGLSTSVRIRPWHHHGSSSRLPAPACPHLPAPAQRPRDDGGGGGQDCRR